MGNVTSTKGAQTSPAEIEPAAQGGRLPYVAPKLVRLGPLFELTMKSGTDFDAITSNTKATGT